MKTTPSCLYYYYCFYFLEPSFLSLSLSLASTEHPGLAAGPSMPSGLQQHHARSLCCPWPASAPLPRPTAPATGHRAPAGSRKWLSAAKCLGSQNQTNKQKKYLQSGCKKCRFVYHGEKLGHRPSVPSHCSFPRGLAPPACSGEATGQSSLLPRGSHGPATRPAGPSFQNRVPGTSCGAAEGLRMVLAAEHLRHTQTLCGCCPSAASRLPGHCSPCRLRALVLRATSALNFNAQHAQTDPGCFPLEGPRVGEGLAVGKHGQLGEGAFWVPTRGNKRLMTITKWPP